MNKNLVKRGSPETTSTSFFVGHGMVINWIMSEHHIDRLSKSSV